MTLNAKRRRLLEALLTAPTRQEAAQAAGVSMNTVRRWEVEPEFANALQDARRRLFADGYARLLSYQSDNLAELYRLATEADSDLHRLRASIALEQALVKRFELLTLADLEARITALEQAQP